MTNFIPFIDSLGLIQGLILGVIIIVLGRGKLTSWFFGLFVITYAIELGDAILHDFGYLEDNHRLALAPLNFFFLNLPLLYLYLETIVGKFTWRTHIWWFLPGILEFSIFLIFFVFYSHFDKEGLNEILEIYTYLSMAFYIVFALFIIYKTWNYQTILNISHSSDKTSNLRWIIYICLFLIIYLGGFTLLEFVPNNTLYTTLISSNVLFIYVISILGIKQKHLEIGGRKEDVSLSTDILNAKDTVPTHYSNEQIVNVDNLNLETGISKDPSQQSNESASKQQYELDKEASTFSILEQKIIAEKHFLDPEINVFKLSRKFRMNSRRFSEIIKNQTGKSFRSYINFHRVNYAKEMIENPSNDHLTMVSIGYDSGFQSKSSYYSSFKEVTKITPIEYKNQIRQKA